MAVFNLAITVPDAEVPRVQAALQARYAVTTNASAVEALRQDIAIYLRNLVMQEERKAQIALITPTNPT